MEVTKIEPEMLIGNVIVPPSKSVAHRAIISAALSGDACKIDNVAFSKDIEATLGCMKSLGALFEYNEKNKTVEFFENNGLFKGKGKLVLNCEESGSTLRFLMPLALLSGREVVLNGKGRLMQRPQKPYFDLFDKLGIEYELKGNKLKIKGRLKAGKFKIAGNVSSQFITGLLFTLPLLDGDSIIEITTEMESKSYLDLTLQTLNEFGIEIINEKYQKFIIAGNQKYKGKNYFVEGDYSQAAFFLVAGAIGCDVGVYGLKENSLQGDKKILDILNEAGARIDTLPDGCIKASRTEAMHGVTIDARDIPDLVPILSVLCAFCPGESRIINAGRLRMKESDRLTSTSSELRMLGADIEEGEDYLKICGKQSLCGETVSAWGDQRIAMMLAIAACRCEGVVSITGAQEAVKKSYPDFFQVYESLKNGPKALFSDNN
ncbi:MAG: 3-phosphoshikimate 1-carboxyvinyltransferase [Clostridia bacterium]|nr:3-phosphoshikimate 1-carboxyvinyltransferase [Clostridia bacterium]